MTSNRQAWVANVDTSNAAECDIWSGYILFVTHPIVFIGISAGSKMDVQNLEQIWQGVKIFEYKGKYGNKSSHQNSELCLIHETALGTVWLVHGYYSYDSKDINYHMSSAGLGGSVRCMCERRSDGHGFHSSWVWQHSFMEIDYEIIYYSHFLPSADSRRAVVSF